jgi:hypothetical protein
MVACGIGDSYQAVRRIVRKLRGIAIAIDYRSKVTTRDIKGSDFPVLEGECPTCTTLS